MPARSLQFSITEKIWPLKQAFRISRGSRTEIHVLVLTVNDGTYTGRGEAVTSKRYNEDIPSATDRLNRVFDQIPFEATPQDIQSLLPASAARNALDCALWDLQAKRSGKRVWDLANITVSSSALTAFTISLNPPAKMAADARENRAAPILKLKLGGDDADLARVEGVRQAAPEARLIIDANESWSPLHYRSIVPPLTQLGVELIEQPFAEAKDNVLKDLERPIPVYADESCHTSADLTRLKPLYEGVNIKLDKTGGLTEALNLAIRAGEMGFKILIGSMVGTSLGMAPARLLADRAQYLDLDGPLLLARDEPHPLKYEHGNIGLPSPDLWG
ncbi:MAG TPA: N-acetyl-D-Glu racemase DgcA [Chthoniobacterales bacterium]|nr:N-acetyl-D-Glu racemase DgcA [Chthoniobacterales bacterium]